jgi:hypothetical protein
LITSCRKIWIEWWIGRGELGSGVFGFPSLSFGDGLQEQHGPGWDVEIGGCRTFPSVGPVVRAVAGLNAGLLKKLPNEFATFGAVIVEGLVGPLAGDEDAAAGDAQMVELVGFAFAPSGGHGVSGAFGLDAVEQPYQAPRRAGGDLELSVQPPDVLSLGVGGALAESGGLANALGQILGEVTDVASGFLAATQDPLDVHLFAESDDVGRFGQPLTCLFPARQGYAGVGVGEGLSPRVPYRHPFPAVNQVVMRRPPHLVISRLGDRS